MLRHCVHHLGRDRQHHATQRGAELLGTLLFAGLLACSPDDAPHPASAAGAPGSGGANPGAGGGATPAGAPATGGAATQPGALPEAWREGLAAGVNLGLAAAYPNDVGITAHAAVLGAEDFETGTVTIPTEENRYRDHVTVTDTEHFTGRYAGVHTWPEGLNGVTTRFPLGPEAHEGERQAYFMRMCFKYDTTFHPGGDASAGVGVKGFGIYYEDGSGNANTCAGMSWYDVSCQFVGWGPSQKPQANDRYLWVGHLYSYLRHPELAVPTLGTVKVTDPPDGTEPCRFSSYAEPFEYLPFGAWRCYELGLYLNTPGQPDGEARFWIDGVLQSRTTSLQFRERPDQLPTSMHLNLHRTTEDFPQTMVRWVDNIVLARRYIGPVHSTP